MNYDRRLLKERSWAVRYPRTFLVLGSTFLMGIIFSSNIYDVIKVTYLDDRRQSKLLIQQEENTK